MSETVTEREQKGIDAIIYLQWMSGVEETIESAREGWRGLSQHDQDFTLEFYDKMKGQTQ